MPVSVWISLYQNVTWTTLPLVLVATAIAWLVYKIIEEKLSPLERIPSPKGHLPLIGHLLELIKKDLHSMLQEWRGKYGPIVCLKLGFGFGFGTSKLIV